MPESTLAAPPANELPFVEGADRHLIGGRLVPGEGRFEVTDPARGTAFASCPVPRRSCSIRRWRRRAGAFPAWAALGFAARRERLHAPRRGAARRGRPHRPAALARAGQAGGACDPGSVDRRPAHRASRRAGPFGRSAARTMRAGGSSCAGSRSAWSAGSRPGISRSRSACTRWRRRSTPATPWC